MQQEWRAPLLRAPTQLYAAPPSGKHGNRDSNSGVPQVKQKVSAVDEVDVAVVRVSPACRPRLCNFEVVAAVGEVRSAAYYLDVTNREVVIVAEMGTKMFVVDSTGMLVMLFFLSSIFIISVLVLGNDGDQSCEKQSSANGSNCCESFHVYTSLKFVSECRAQ
jgi:hypothetical protein